jgi:hypothetical protein
MAFLTFHILGRIIPTDEYFSEGSEGLKPPTRYTYTVDIHIDTHVDIHMLYIGIQKLANLQPTHKVIHKLHIFKAFSKARNSGSPFHPLRGSWRRVYFPRHAGHLVRTKAQGVDEGGVAAGYAVISSPYLTG